MAKFLKKQQGKWVEFDGYDMCLNNKTYHYGTLIKKDFNSDTIPTCNLCGSELQFKKIGKVFWIHKCLNDECKTNQKVYGDIKLEAFLPHNIFAEIKETRRKNHHSYFDIDYLINSKGMSQPEALEYIETKKKQISVGNTGHNKEYFINKFGEIKYNEFLKEKKKYMPNFKEYWINKGYSEEESIVQVKKHQKDCSSKVKNRTKIDKSYVEKLGYNADDFFRKRSRLCKEYWIDKGKTEDEAISIISELQKLNSSKVKQCNSDKKISYWTAKGYSEYEAKDIIRKLQKTFSKDICIEKYGEEEGLKRWKQRQEQWQKSLHENGNLHIGYSRVSQELFNELMKYYNEDEIDYVFYGSKNREYSIKNNDNNYYYAYDFTDLNKRKIIEFNGDIYHANPQLYKEQDCPNPFYPEKNALILWEQDKQKVNTAKRNGFDVLVVWEYDYTHNRNSIMQTILQFLELI